MAFTVKSLNGDTTFLLTLNPTPTTPASDARPFTILIDPWLTGPAQVLSRQFAFILQKDAPCLSSLKELPAEPDLVLISQDQPDHCHKETLCQLPPDTRSRLLAAPSAARKIRRWKHFDPSRVLAMQPYSARDDTTVYRHEIPAAHPSQSPGEVTIAYITQKFDLTGVHNAIGITYRASGGLDVATCKIERPSTPPDSPMASWDLSAREDNHKSLEPPSFVEQKTVSLIYSPHGVSYNTIRPYASHHLKAESAYPVAALIHSLDRVRNPWYFGGNIAAGLPGGLSLAINLECQTWIAAHDAAKDKSGISVQLLKVDHYALEAAFVAVRDAASHSEKDVIPTIVALDAGHECRVGAT